MRIFEAFRHDADDFVTLAVERQRPMKDVSGRGEHGLPKSSADDCNLVVAWPIVVGRDGAAERRQGLKGLKEIAIHARHADALRRSRRGETGDGLIESRYVLE